MTIYSAHTSKRRNSTKLFGCDHHILLSLYHHVNTFITSYINSLKWLMHSRAHMWWNFIQTCCVYVPACVLIYITPISAIKIFLYVNIWLQSYVYAIRIHWFYNNVKPLIITGEEAHKTLGCNNVNEQSITRDTWFVYVYVYVYNCSGRKQWRCSLWCLIPIAAQSSVWKGLVVYCLKEQMETIYTWH